MVGACADWFAIVALFRRPFGLLIPHTGIVPANKDRIGSALGRFITNNFLYCRGAAAKALARIDVLGSLGHGVSEPANAKRLGDYFAALLPRIASSLPAQQIGEFGRPDWRSRRWRPSRPRRWRSKMLAVIWAQGEAQAFLAHAIEYSETWIADNKAYLTRKISQQSSRWIPKWIDKIYRGKGGLKRHAGVRSAKCAIRLILGGLSCEPGLRS